VRSFSADSLYMARVLDSLARDPQQVVELQTAGTDWARAHSWTALAPMYRERLASACS
jgi:hypothetical protein